MYALVNPTVGQIVESRAGHDTGRRYLLVSAVGKDFVLVSDGKLRPLDNPKCKRVKHLRYIGESAEAASAIARGALDDAAVRKAIASASEKTNL